MFDQLHAHILNIVLFGIKADILQKAATERNDILSLEAAESPVNYARHTFEDA